MKWWEISWFRYVFMAPSSIFLTFSWEISHNIIILRFCNIVEGQANKVIWYRPSVKNSFGLFSDFRVSCLTSISLSRCAIPMSFCTLQEWGKVFGHHQNFEMNDFLPTQPTNYSTNFPLYYYYINFEYCANLQHQQPSNLTF